jgi:UDP-2,3-diacylglucosamine pyrophosphatase LpxH
MDAPVNSKNLSVRTVFISDVHLGTRGSQAQALLDFLKHCECKEIFLVGDIVDGWRLKKVWHWPQTHNDVVQKLLRKARKGTRVVYIPGNHDEFLRDYVGSTFGGVEVLEEALHICADGRKMLILHGDKFDTVVRNVRWLALLGDQAYDFAIWLNRHIARVRRFFGLPYWSFSQWSKDKVKSAVSFVTAFEEAVVRDAHAADVDIVLCGHIHKAAIKQIGDVTYVNAGDWVESCSAILEHFDGRLELCFWHQARGEIGALKAPVTSEVLAA